MPRISVAEFDACFLRYRPILEAYARRRVSREDAEDLVSGCFLQARRSLNSYQSERNMLAWLKGILENMLRLHFRQVRHHREIGYGVACPIDSEAQGELEAARESAQRYHLQRCLAAVDLTARQYECLVRILEGETQRRIAGSLGIAPRTVSYHVQMALEHLRKFAGRQKSEKDIDAFEFFYACAHHPIYRKPHSFDNRSNSPDREQHRYACLREERRREECRREERRKEKAERQKNIFVVHPVKPENPVNPV